MQAEYKRIERAIEFIRSCDQPPEVASIAKVVGLSVSHFHDEFRKWTGVSPVRFVQERVVSVAKSQLGRRSILDVSLDLGLSSSSRLHDAFVSIEAMTPGEFKRGPEVSYGVHWTELGPVVLGQTDRGICCIEFLDKVDREAAETRIQARYPNAALTFAPEDTAASANAAFYPPGWDATEPLLLHLKGTNFQIQVWRALLSIPMGQTTTYGKLADSIDRPSASRAVGTAIGANPAAYVIPCHRVIRADGGLGGYRWGVETKSRILNAESVSVLKQ